MKSQAVKQHKQRLDHIFLQVSAFSSAPELKSHWARYLCVLVSGFVETSIQTIFSEYAKKRSSPEVASYVESRLKRFQNPSMQRIINLIGEFNPVWRESFEMATDGEPKDAINSIVANRNNIAHGESVGITYSRIQQYYENAIKVVDLIDDQCNG